MPVMGHFTARRLLRLAVITVGLAGPAAVLPAARSLYWDPLPYRDSDRLFVLKGASQPRGVDVSRWFGQAPSVERLTVMSFGRANWRQGERTSRVDVLVADSDTSSVFGLTSDTGRSFLEADLRDGSVALVSARFARRWLSGNPLGAVVNVNTKDYFVVGVAPDALARLGPFDIVLPRQVGRMSGPALGETESALGSMVLVARARAGASANDVLTDIERLQREAEAARGGGRSRVSVVHLRVALGAPSRPVMGALILAALVLFALAAVTTGMLAGLETVDRLGDLAMRLTLGATPAQLRVAAARTWLMDLPLAVVLAALLAFPASEVLGASLPGLQVEVPLVTTALALGAVFGGTLVAVAVSLALTPLGSALHSPVLLVQGRSTTGRGARLMTALVSLQIAFSMALLCATAVAVGGLRRQVSRDIGLRSSATLYRVHLGEGLTPETMTQRWAGLLPGLRGWDPTVAVATGEPWLSGRSLFVRDPRSEEGALASITHVSPGFLSAVGIRIVAGVEPYATGAPTREIVVSSGLAKKLGLQPGDSLDFDGDRRRVAAVASPVGDLRSGVASDALRVYAALDAGFWSEANAVIAVANASPGLRGEIERLLPGAIVSDSRSIKDEFADLLRRQHAGSRLLVAYTALALTLVGAGLFVTMSREVGGRRRELGIRVALGARPGDLRRTLLRRVASPWLGGTVAGIWLGAVLSMPLVSFLPWASPADAMAYASSAAVAGATGLLALWRPLAQASRADPAELLRGE
jgi:putative ABC transport system permease protein